MVDFKSNQEVFGYVCDTNATIAPVGVSSLANHYLMSQAPEHGKIDDDFAPPGACRAL